VSRQPIVMKLPPPLSLNKYWRPVPIKGPNGEFQRSAMVPTSEAKAFKEDIGWRVRAYGVTAPWKCRVAIHLEIYPALPQDHLKRQRANPLNWDDDVRCIDIDNARKVLYDAFNGVLWTDDKQVFRDSAERMEPDGEARMVVTVSEYIRELNPQGSLL